MEKITRLLGLLFLLIFFSNYVSAKESEIIPDKKHLIHKLSSIQIPFIENQGQIKESSVKFYANTFAGIVFVTDKGELVYSLSKIENKSQNIDDTNKSEFNTPDLERRDQNSILKTIAIREHLECPKQSKIKGMNKSATAVNYFIGDKSSWKTNLQTWQEISMGEVYENIELKLSIHGKNVEKLFTIYPLGSVNDIELKIEGAKGLNVNKDGELEIETELGIVKMTKPVAYQEIEGERKYIQVAYNVSSDSNNYGFEVGQYDNKSPLIIDPLLASTFIGGSNANDDPANIAMDSSGNIFVAGSTWSSNYPTTTGAYDTSYNGYYPDGFISKFNSDLTSLLASTFIGGWNDFDGIQSLALDSSGNVFVAGLTESTDYPTTSGAYDTTHNGGVGDGFVSKLNNNLSSLLTSTFIGGNLYDYVLSLSVDYSNNVFITGKTGSSNYPTTVGAYDTTFNGGYDGFISKFDNNLSTLISSTFIGGSNGGYAESIAISSSGNIFIAGMTQSSDYPITIGAYDATLSGIKDGFISKLDNNLSTLLASTFIGGSNVEYAYSLSVDSSYNIFVAGATLSSDFPTTPGAYNSQYNGGYEDGFIAKLNNDLTILFSSTVIGGIDEDYANSLTLDSLDNVIVAGGTRSYDYPVTSGAYDTTYNAYNDVFVSKLDNNLCQYLPVRIGGATPVYYSTLQEAYDASVDSATIQSHAAVFNEDLFFDLNKSVLLDGGCNCGYSTNTEHTTIKGSLIINNGTVHIKSGTFKIEQ